MWRKYIIVGLTLVMLLTIFGEIGLTRRNGQTYIHYAKPSQNLDCHEYFNVTGSGIVHVWNYAEENLDCDRGTEVSHFVFLPYSKFGENVQCDPPADKVIEHWNKGTDKVDYPDDEGDYNATFEGEYLLCIYLD